MICKVCLLCYSCDAPFKYTSHFFRMPSDECACARLARFAAQRAYSLHSAVCNTPKAHIMLLLQLLLWHGNQLAFVCLPFKIEKCRILLILDHGAWEKINLLRGEILKLGFWCIYKLYQLWSSLLLAKRTYFTQLFTYGTLDIDNYTLKLSLAPTSLTTAFAL